LTEFFTWLVNLIKELQCWSVVQPWERAVRVRIGKHAVLWEPGIYFRVPLIDSVKIVNNRMRVYPFPCQTVTTRDGQTLTVAGVVGFRVADPLAAMLKIAQPEMSCAAFAQSAIAEYIASRDLANVRIEGIEAAALARLTAVTSGIVFDFVRIVDFAAVKTIRLLQESWRPATNVEVHI